MARTKTTSIRIGKLRRDLGQIARLLAVARREHSTAPRWGAVAFQIATAEEELRKLELVAFELLAAPNSPNTFMSKTVDMYVSIATAALTAVGLEFRDDIVVLTPAILICQPRPPSFATCEDESYADKLCTIVRKALQRQRHALPQGGVDISGTLDEWGTPYAEARKAGKFDASGVPRANTPPHGWPGISGLSPRRLP